MSVIDVNSYNITALLKDYDLLSDEYDSKQITRDLSMLYYQPWIMGKKEEDDIKSYFSKIHSLVTDDCKIKSKADLQTLTLSDKKDEQVLNSSSENKDLIFRSELDDRVDIYSDVIKDYKLPSISSIKNNPNVIIAKIEYCKKFSIPFADENGVLLEELFDEYRSNLYFGRFHELLNEYATRTNDQNYINAINTIEDDKQSKVYALIQSYIYSKYHKFAEIPENLKRILDNTLEDPTIDLSQLVQTIYMKLRESNPFIEESSFKEFGNVTKANYDEENRGCGRR